MKEIAEMTQHMVKKAKEYDRDTIPGDYSTLVTACPNCAGVVKENYRRYSCCGKTGDTEGCGFSFGKTPGGRTFEQGEVEQFIKDKKIGPLEGFRSKAGWPFTAEIALKFNEEEKNWKLEFDFGEDKNGETGEIVTFDPALSLGACPKCKAPVFEWGSNYICSKSVPTLEQPTPSCTFKSGKIVLQQPIEIEQIQKLLITGKTDLLDKFVSMRTRRPFKAYLSWDEEAGKVSFAFEPRNSKYPPRKTAAAKTTSPISAKKSTAKAPKATKITKTARKPSTASASTKPNSALAAVIGPEAVARTQIIKKLWDYIKEHNLQDPSNKRNILADTKLREVFGKDSVTMFELAGIVGKNLVPI